MIGKESFDDIDVQIAWIENKLEKNKEEMIEFLHSVLFDSICSDSSIVEEYMIEFADFCSNYEIQQKIDAEERYFEEERDERK